MLRLLAVNFGSFPSTLRSKMKLSPCFLGTKRLAAAASGSSVLEIDDEDDEGGESTLVYQLARASELIINDEPAGPSCCPLRDRVDTSS